MLTELANGDYRFQSYIKGLRSWGLRPFLLHSIAATGQLRLSEVEESKGPLRTTVYFTLEGPLEAMEAWRELVNQALSARGIRISGS